jgi:hypothetical protein
MQIKVELTDTETREAIVQYIEARNGYIILVDPKSIRLNLDSSDCLRGLLDLTALIKSD